MAVLPNAEARSYPACQWMDDYPVAERLTLQDQGTACRAGVRRCSAFRKLSPVNAPSRLIGASLLIVRILPGYPRSPAARPRAQESRPQHRINQLAACGRSPEKSLARNPERDRFVCDAVQRLGKVDMPKRLSKIDIQKISLGCLRRQPGYGARREPSFQYGRLAAGGAVDES